MNTVDVLQLLGFYIVCYAVVGVYFDAERQVVLQKMPWYNIARVSNACWCKSSVWVRIRGRLRRSMRLWRCLVSVSEGSGKNCPYL